MTGPQSPTPPHPTPTLPPWMLCAPMALSSTVRGQGHGVQPCRGHSQQHQGGGPAGGGVPRSAHSGQGQCKVRLQGIGVTVEVLL